MACTQGWGNPSATVKDFDTYCLTDLEGSKAAANPTASIVMLKTKTRNSRFALQTLHISASWAKLLLTDIGRLAGKA